MVRQKLGIIYVGLSHINMILKLEKIVRKICLMMSAYDCQLYTFVLIIKAQKQRIQSDDHGEIDSEVILAVP